MRRALLLLWSLSLVLMGCADSGGESGDSTSAFVLPTSTTLAVTTSAGPASGWVSSVVDVGGAVGQRPFLAIDAEGRSAVVSQRETAPFEYDLVLTYCVDVECSGTTDLVLGSGRLYPTAIGATSDGPLVLGFLLQEDGTSSTAIWSCGDTECESAIETTIEAAPVALYANPDGLPLLVYGDQSIASEGDPSAFEVVIGYCEDNACSTHIPVKVHQGTVGFSFVGGSLHMLSDGSPVVFFPGAEGMDTVWDVIVCQDPECSEVVVHHQDGSWADAGGPAPPEMPSQVYAAFKQIRQLACGDPDCSTITDSLIQPMDQAEYALEVQSGLAGDQLVLLTQAMNEWYEPEPDEDGLVRWSLELFHCDTTGCSPVSSPVSEGIMTAMAVTSEKDVAVAVLSGRGALCNPEGDYCVDPNEPHSQLSLYTTQIDPD